MNSPNDAVVDVYLDTIRRLEPDIHMIDDGAGWASCAISLRRIADSLEELLICLKAKEEHTHQPPTPMAFR